MPAWADPVWHLFVVRHPERDALQRSLSEAGIGTLIHYPIPPHKQDAYTEAGHAADSFPLAARIADEILSLPMGPQLSEPAVDHVVACLDQRGRLSRP